MDRSIVVIFLFLQCFSLVYNQASPDYEIKCEEDQMTVEFSVMKWNPPFTLERQFDVMFTDPACNNGNKFESDVNGTDMIHINITTTYDQCDSVVTNHTDNICVNNTATLTMTEWLRADNKTKRVHLFEYHISCCVDRVHNIITSDSYTVDYNTKNFTEENEKVDTFDFDFEMKFFKTSSYSSEHSPGVLSVNTNEMIYVQITEGNSNSHFRPVVTECAADKTKTYNPATADIFFQNRCSMDPTFKIYSSVTSPNDFQFEVQAFSFIQTTDAVFFHCKVYICKTDSDASACDQRCPTNGRRYRRDVDDGRLREEIVTSPLIRYNRNVDCGDINCGINSKCAPLKPARCICDDGYVYSRNESKCVNHRIVQIVNIHLDKEWKENYADPKHPDFLRLAFKYEDVLYKSFIAAGVTRAIEGIRIISASPGSIILDTEIIYGPKTTLQEAYNAFVKSITSEALHATTVRRELQLLTDRTPAIVEVQKDMADIQKLTLIIIVVVLLLVVLMSGILIFAIRRNRKRTTKLDVDGTDNGGLEMKYPS